LREGRSDATHLDSDSEEPGMKLLIVGGFLGVEPTEEEERFAKALGREAAAGGHVVLNGCFNSFDRTVAEAAFTEAEANGLFGDPSHSVQGFVAKGATPSHRFGRIRGLHITDWDPGQQGWDIPEPIAEADAVICMGGGPGTHRAINLSRMAGKPILPITSFGGAGIEAFSTELARFDEAYEGRVPRDEFTLLDTQFPEDLEELARQTVSLAVRIVSGNSVFIVMSFRPESDDTFNTIRRVLEDHGLDTHRTDKDHTTDRIFQRIVSGIQRASFVVADVTHQSLNVYYELGFAEALQKPVVVLAKEGTELPFDTRDIPTIFYPDQTRLEEALGPRVRQVSGRRSRRGDL
jgi:hypothetical protein